MNTETIFILQLNASLKTSHLTESQATQEILTK